MSLSLTDLFIVGLGLDLAGAVFGRMSRPRAIKEIARLNTWGGLERGVTVERCRNWVDALFGVFYLGLGFFLQGGGYFAQLAGVEPESGGSRPAVASAILLLVLAGATATWGVLRKRVFKGLLMAVARSRPGDAAGRELDGWSREKVQRLLELGEDAGWEPRANELVEGGQLAYVERVFGLRLPSALYEPD